MSLQDGWTLARRVGQLQCDDRNHSEYADPFRPVSHDTHTASFCLNMGKLASGFVPMKRGLFFGNNPANHASYSECSTMASVSFESVVEQYYEALYRFAFSLARTEADACDLTQQTFYIWATKGHQLRDPIERQNVAFYHLAPGLFAEPTQKIAVST